MEHPLDNPAWTALTGSQAHLAERRGRAARYPVDVSPFAAVADPAAAWPDRNGGAAGAGWADLAALVGPGGVALVPEAPERPPAGWELVVAVPGVQMDGSGLTALPDPEAVVLGPADVPAMLDLAARTRPGPFLDRTPTLGTYLGVRRAGALIAMAGERMRPPGWTEISAVCTDPAHRGQGLAGRLVRALAVGIRARGDVPFLHAAADNHAGIRLYEQLGFTRRRAIHFAALRALAPADRTPAHRPSARRPPADGRARMS